MARSLHPAGVARFLLPVLAIAGSAAAAVRSSEEIARIAKEAIAGLDLQLDLPHEAEAARSWHVALPREFIWGVAILGALFLIYFLVREVLPGLRLAAGGEEWAEGDATDGVAAAPHAAAIAAEELARQGRFVEAMHMLLLQALAEIRRLRDQGFAESLTSREILRRVRLSEQGEASLRDIVARVEWSYFGEHPAGPEDYRGCRDSFERLTAALNDGAAA